MLDPASVKALIFDVFGTVVDWRTSVARESEAVLKPQLANVAPDRGLELEILDRRVRIAVTGGAGLVAQQRNVAHKAPFPFPV